MSELRDVRISFNDRRDETPSRFSVVFHNLPDELDRRDVEMLFSRAMRQMRTAIDVDPTHIDIDRLRAARDRGDISQAVYDALTAD